MSCARCSGAIRRRRSVTDPRLKTKGHLKGWPDCLLCLAPRMGLKSTTCELTVVFLSPHLGVKKLNQLNQMPDYTAPDVNMLHLAKSRAANNKIKRN